MNSPDDGASARPTVVVVDWNVRRRSPAGGTILEFVKGLHHKYRFVVVAGHFENPSPADIEHVSVRLPPGPAFITELCWPSIVRLKFLRRTLRKRRPAVTIATQGQLPAATIASAHCCHRAYLSEYFATSGTRGLRRVTRFLVHRYYARLERRAFQKACTVTVPSRGLWHELARYYPSVAEKLVHVPNPIDVARFAPEAGFDRGAARARLDLDEGDVAFVLVALGNFAHKGLGVAIRGAALLSSNAAKIVVVGGTSREISRFRRLAGDMGVAESIRFVGFDSDIRPYLWASDVFLFPTIYETFSKASYEAAAARLPVIATRVHGIEDLIQHGVNGWYVERTPRAIADAMATAVAARETLQEMGERAQDAVRAYDIPFYVKRWDDILSAATSSFHLRSNESGDSRQPALL